MPHANPKSRSWNGCNKPTLKNCNLPKERLTKRNVRLDSENIFIHKFNYVLKSTSPTGRPKEYIVTDIHFYDRIDGRANIVVSSTKGCLYTENCNAIDVLIVPVDEIPIVRNPDSQKAVEAKDYKVTDIA